MNPGQRNITTRQGTTFALALTWSKAGSPLPPGGWTGWSAQMQARTGVGGELFLDLTTANGGIALVEPGGIRLLAAPVQLPLRHIGLYELRLTSPSGEVIPLLAGAFVIEPSVIGAP